MPCWGGSARKEAVMRIEAPAKLNMVLRVLGRRDDGFHELETLMVPVPGLADVIEIAEADEFSFCCAGADVPSDESNLVVRAVRLFERETGRVCRNRVSLTKRVPHGAGLGGGSSDAAAVLRAMDGREQTGLGRERLAAMAAELGSDVPFFLDGGACWCRGRGEILEPASVGRHAVVLLKPAFGVGTPDAYGRWKGARELAGVSYGGQAVDGLELVNALERPVFEKFLFLAELKMWLREQPGVRAALMSGSGATVFAVLEREELGDAIAARARDELDPTLWSWTGGVGGD